MEQLEDRLVPSITDMTQLAQLFPVHPGPTHLYLNFDGWHDSTHAIASFAGTYQDIQDILFRTSEILTPFNVEVSRMFGDGNYDHGAAGNTTIFIGANSANVDAQGVKYAYGFTPWISEDFPGSKKGDQHQPNSDPYDVSFVDPVGQKPYSPAWVMVWSDARISQIIGHEAGTSFGLAHTLTAGTPDLMSYDSSESYYADHTYPITILNFTGTQTLPDRTQQPIWQGTNLVTQNSFTYLKAVLGDRPKDGAAHVADPGTIDPSVQPVPPTSISMGSPISGVIGSPGDYTVYRFDAPATESALISLTPAGIRSLVPVLLIHDQFGNLIQVGSTVWNAGQGDYEVHTVLKLQAGRSYFVIVGSLNGVGTGAYNLSIVRQVSLVGLDPQTGGLWVSSTAGSYFTTSKWGAWSSSATWVDVQVADFNGDGKMDMVGRVKETGQWWVGLSTGSSFTFSLWGTWSTAVTWVDVKVGDFNGDGRMDIAGRALETGQWWVGLSNGTGFATSLWTTWSTAVTWVDVQVGDFNGDGKADIAGRALETGQWWVGSSTGAGFRTWLWATWSSAVTWVDVQVGDFNGDHKTDIIGRVLQTGQWWLGLSTGSSFSTRLWATWSPAVTWVDIKVGDFNGDGNSDIIGRDPKTGIWWVSYANSLSAFATTFLYASWSPAVHWVDVQVADFNGDGRDDITARDLSTGNWWVAVSNGTTGVTSLWTTWSTAVAWVDVHAGVFV